VSLSFSISIRDEVTPLLRSLPATLGGDGIKLAIGRGVARLIQANFAALQSQRPNRHGWPRQGYWAQAARSVSQPKPDANGVTISIAQPGIAARWFGPTEIKPVAAKTLAIPASPEAYGTRPLDARWSGKLEFSMVGGKYMALVARDNFMRIVAKGKNAGKRVKASAEKATHGAGEIIFWLKRKVTMPQDKTVLPAAEDITAAAVMAAQDYVNAALAKGGKA